MLIRLYAKYNNVKSSITTVAPSLCHLSNKAMECGTNKATSERKQLSFNGARNLGRIGYKLNVASFIAIGNTYKNLRETPTKDILTFLTMRKT